MELPKRKPNRLQGYDYSNNGAYFVTVCAKNREEIFGSVGDGVHDVPINGISDTVDKQINNLHINLTHIRKIVEKHIAKINLVDNVTVDKYVIMPNHIHMILVINKPFCSDKIQYIDGTPRTTSPTNAIIPRTISGFKRLVNKEAEKNIFQRSYHDHIIRGEKDYVKIWEYIEANPQKWKEDCFYSKNNH